LNNHRLFRIILSEFVPPEPSKYGRGSELSILFLKIIKRFNAIIA
jgi:hypothetical protein